jgi:hypothetical protein
METASRLATLGFAALAIHATTLGTAQAQYFTGNQERVSAGVSWDYMAGGGTFQDHSKQSSAGAHDTAGLAVTADLPEGNHASVSGGTGGDKITFNSAFKAIAPQSDTLSNASARSDVSYSLSFSVLRPQQYLFSLDVSLDPFDQGTDQPWLMDMSYSFKLTGPIDFAAPASGPVVFDRTSKESFTASFSTFLGDGDYFLVAGGHSVLDRLATGPLGGSQQFSLTPIPEPSTYSLMLAGIAALGAWNRRRRLAGPR